MQSEIEPISTPHHTEVQNRCLVIMPAFNEESSIVAILRELKAFAPDFDVAVVDDGSRDLTASIAKQHGAIVLPLPFNLGIGGAVQAGFMYAYEHSYDIAVQVDSDGQHDPSQLAKLVKPILDDAADVVIGSRYLEGGTFSHAIHRRALISVFARIVTLATGQRFTDTSSSFRAYNRKAIEICASDYPHGFLESIESTVSLSRYRLRMLEIPVTIRQRSTGESALSLGRTMAYSIKVFIAISMG